MEREKELGGDGVSWFRGALIGKGSFGSVYLANLKRPNSKFRCFPETMAVKSAEVSVSGSIQKEREVLSNIGWCPNIIQCFGDEITTEANGVMVYNLLLEYGSGGTLADLIKKSGGKGLIESDVRYYTRCILRGLNRIHECGYVHCDLKPENILLVNSNRTSKGSKFDIKIGDFGLAKRAKPSSKKRKLNPYLRGTPMYLSPEAAKYNIQEAPSDIWALGCIVLEMFTGKSPWDGNVSSESLLSKIGDSYELPKIPSEISKEGKEFLKGCFSRKSMYRLTAEMLLYHSFVEGLPDDEREGEEGETGLTSDMVGYYGSEGSISDDCWLGSDDEVSISSWAEDENECLEFQLNRPGQF